MQIRIQIVRQMQIRK